MKSLGAIAIAAVFGIVSPAAASIVTYTYTGTVSSGYDGNGDFGPPNTSLTGDPFTLVYTLDTAKGTYSSSSFQGSGTGYDNVIIGGTNYNNSIPVSAVLTIAGRPFSGFATQSVSFGSAEAFGSPGLGLSGIYQQAVTESDFPNVYTFVLTEIAGNFGAFSPSLATTYSISIGNGLTSASYFQDANQNAPHGFDDDSNATLNPTMLTVACVVGPCNMSATPLPSTWILLLSGFAALGFIARRSTKNHGTAVGVA